MAQKEKTIEEKNVAYFQALANSRASLNQLQIGLIVSWVPALFFYLSVSGQIKNLENYPPLPIVMTIFNILFFTFIVIGLYSLFEKVVYHFQLLSSYIFVLLVVAITIFVVEIGYFLAVIPNANGNFLYSISIFYLGLATIIISIIVNTFLLRHRLKVGFSENRTTKNFLAVSGAYSSKTLWIIFAAVMIVPNVLTQGKYIMNIFGIICVIGFGAIFPSPLVEFSYLAYLKTKDKKYWEERPYHEKKSSAQKKALVLRIGTWVYVALSLFFIYEVGEIYGNKTYPLIISIIGLLILISYAVLFIKWLLKKVQTRKKKK